MSTEYLAAEELKSDCKEIAKCAALCDFAMALCGSSVRISRKRIDGTAFVVISLNGEEGLFNSADIAKEWLVSWALKQERWLVLVVDEGGNAETHCHLTESAANSFRDKYQSTNPRCHFAVGKAVFSDPGCLRHSAKLEY